MSGLESLTRDYRTGFLRYLPRRSEAALTAGYELGRRAATSGAGLLDLVRVHHEVLGEVIGRQPVARHRHRDGCRVRVPQRGAVDLRDGPPRAARPSSSTAAHPVTSAEVAAVAS